MKPASSPCGYFMISSTAVLVSEPNLNPYKTAVVVPDGNTVVLLKYAMALYDNHTINYYQGA